MLLRLIFLLCCWGIATGKPNCDSNLRILFPQWFTHCDCVYSEWSEWKFIPDSVVDVLTSQCITGRVYSESRTRSVLGQDCLPDTDTRDICAPDQEDILIEALGLGSQDMSVPTMNPQIPTLQPQKLPSPLPPWPVVAPNIVPKRCPQNDNTGKICINPDYTSGKRSIHREFQPIKRSSKIKEPILLPKDPIPYDRKEHGARFRRSPNVNCQPNGEQYILFLLDISGSIGSASFNKVKIAVSNLTALFCSPPKIGMMTFSTDFNLEFCFDCFDCNLPGRLEAQKAIRAIRYRGGSTKTGGAAKCACDDLLTPSCGMPSDATCIDVVFITDGKSNDPHLEVCDEVKCLHNHLKEANTYAIGIGNYNEDEINCIAHSSDLRSAFRFDDFDDFEKAVQNIINRLQESLFQNGNYTCAHTDGSLGN